MNYPFKCTECLRCYREVKTLEQHFSKEHRIEHENFGSFICPKCPKEFTHLYKLNIHDLVDHGDKMPFSCDQCKSICLDFGRCNIVSH